MSASAHQKRARKYHHIAPNEYVYVSYEDYCRQWQVDPDCVKANDRELGRMESHIVRTAVYRLIALRWAAVSGERDSLPDPRLVNPELRTRATRNVLHLAADLLSRFTLEARGAGWSWHELATFESVAQQIPEWASTQTLTWGCGDCNQKITDRGPHGHPSDRESGHAADCTRHDQEIAAYERRARPVIDPTLLRAGPQSEEDNSTQNLCRTVRSNRCSCARCFYCERTLASRRHEHDHFPVPRSTGGRRVVPACLDCHELKDQYNLCNWPRADLAAAWRNILACLKHESFPDSDDLTYLRRTCWWEEQPDSSDDAVIARWAELSPLSRVLYAKARAGKERYKYALSNNATLTRTDAENAIVGSDPLIRVHSDVDRAFSTRTPERDA
ncbi:HNH endonuclease [Allokutzneria sp. NRRL B-24872]|uniref:HNH endonuclease n=1 Tax=Allokutzneria sp. NRRL B-24872 TaxID=1137961 RepID=UPI0011783844|nr:hypothetical protein [Allokutzneria sp. NRRL B-24872]